MTFQKYPFQFFNRSLRIFAIALAIASSLYGAEYIVSPIDGISQRDAIVLPWNDGTQSGMDWRVISQLKRHSADPNVSVLQAVNYLQEAVLRMTGKDLEVISTNDLSQGIVLTLLADAPDDIRNDPEVVEALKTSDKDSFNGIEAFYIRTEPNRILVVANTAHGLRHGVVELLESVGYEVLGMGPNWTHVPDFRTKPLVFDLDTAGRPGLYNRKVWATSAQDRGNGTLLEVFDEADEPVGQSYLRWQIGKRLIGSSMPQVGGHSMQAYHREIADRMIAENSTEGFLAKTILGLDAERPASPESDSDLLWINTDAEGSPEFGKVYYAVGGVWVLQQPKEFRPSLDLTLDMVRSVALEDLKSKAQAHFESSSDSPLVFGADPEDGGGLQNFAKFRKNPNWYPDYLAQEGISFGQPYKLHGFKGLDQPNEIWDPNSPSDAVFGFANWLGREYDKWIDSLPEDQRVTASGRDRKELLTIGLLSYNFYDVPPNFNLDQRIRVKMSTFPKHRGAGKWANFVSTNDMAEAFQVLLPRQPSDVGLHFSNARYTDQSINILSKSSDSVENIQQRVADAYQAGFRGIGAEMDFNFGRLGLAFYLYAKMLWNPEMSAEDLASIRDRWLQRAYGSGWEEMKAYYELMEPQGFINAPNTWAKAIRLIASADGKIDPENEPDAQRRIDDLKQFWYFYYLIDSDQGTAKSRAMQEFLWKGQMSYMTPMVMVVARIFKTKKVNDAIPADIRSGPAHYTPAETKVWWDQVLNHWNLTPVSNFKEAKLADGSDAGAVDLNDLVAVSEFQADESDDAPFIYNGPRNRDMTILQVSTGANEEIGCKLFWPWNPEVLAYSQKTLSCGVARWDTGNQEWENVVDETMTTIPSVPVEGLDGQTYQMVEVRYPTTRPGTYRITLSYGGSSSQLASLDYDLLKSGYSGTETGFTYSGNYNGHTQSPAWFYIPKGTKSVDLEVWDTNGKKELTFHTGLPSTGLKRSRVVDVGKRGTHVVEVEPGEDGSLVSITGGGFYFPYLYSVPQLWAKGPSALLVPRAIAKADGLSIIGDPVVQSVANQPVP